jgi:hypothetical protein
MEEYDIQRLDACGAAAWEYLQEQGQTDLAQLNQEQARELFLLIVRAFNDCAPF